MTTVRNLILKAWFDSTGACAAAAPCSAAIPRASSSPTRKLGEDRNLCGSYGKIRRSTPKRDRRPADDTCARSRTSGNTATTGSITQR
jgi:hypothetical protein